MSETKTLLLTDLVDSTRLSETLGDAAMAELWTAHDRLARDLLPAWRGREIDKTDGLLLLFDAPADAAGYALAYHAALAGLPQAVLARAGIHQGPVTLRENPAADVARGAKPLEVDGLAKPVAARVMSMAQGGQTLLTADAMRALGPTPPDHASHGHWMVKGVREPLELYEIGPPGALFHAPPDGDKVYRVTRIGERWLPTRQVPNNLPAQMTSFIGRERELDDIKHRLQSNRLLTLLGMGGLGKTRLSLQAASELLAEFPDGAWFLDLAPLRDPQLVVGEAAQALGVREEPGRPLLQTLLAHLKPRRALIVMDNCEHLVRACAELAHAVLRAAPDVHLLASSRELLHVPGEQALPILPLPLPGRDDGLAALGRSTAVRLFVARAKAHKPSFELTEREAPAVAELVARLEGIPLALELAAARVRSLSVADINARLKDRYRILTGGAKVLQERQQTLRALVDWSYDLLTEPERRVLDRLGVFCGGFDLAAAEQVCGADPLLPEDVLDLLDSLVEKSLVMTEEHDEGLRYRMLETIRDYAREKLDAAGETAATAAQHCHHYFAWAKEASAGLRSTDQASWVWRTEAELDNLRAAMALALAGGVDTVIAVKFAVAVQGFWALRGYATEGRAYVRAALALPSIQSSDMGQAHALYVGAALAAVQCDHADARHLLEACLALRRRIGRPVDIAATLSTLSLACLQGGDPDGADEAEHEALRIFGEQGDRYGQAIGLLHMAQIDLYRGDDDAARLHIDLSLTMAREIGLQEIEAECERVLGQIAHETGDPDDSERWFKRALQVCRDSGDRRGEASALAGLGKADLRRGDLPSARQRLTEAAPLLRRFEQRDELLDTLDALAGLLRHEGHLEPALLVAATAVQARARLGLQRPPRAEQRWQDELRSLHRATGAAALPEGADVPDLDAALQLAATPRVAAALPA
ncbi:MAG: tetratricopeptide repeat protein [Aquabacterium sp.]